MKLKVDPIGGQAVIEGVMMRGPLGVGVALRTPEGTLHLKQEALTSLRERYPLLKLPLLRGVAALVESMGLGIRMLNYSAAIATGEEPDRPMGLGDWLPMILGLALFIGIFKVLPAMAFVALSRVLEAPLALSALEGLIRIALFVGYLAGLSLLPDVRRLFEYHGAEHQVINCVEAGLPLTVENARARSPIHPRCGTSFLLVTLLIQIAVFSLLGTGLSVLERVGAQLCLLPLVAGVSFELIRLAGQATRDGASPVARLALALTLPGQWLQRVTTRPAAPDQIEVAIASLEAALSIRPVGAQAPVA